MHPDIEGQPEHLKMKLPLYLTRPILLTPGTEFLSAPTKTEHVGEGHVMTTIGLSKDTAGSLIYFVGEPGSPERAQVGHLFSESNPDDYIPNPAAAIPRSSDMLRWTPAEHAINLSVDMVEEMGAHPHLTRACVLLVSARQAVAAFVDGEPVDEETDQPKIPVGDANKHRRYIISQFLILCGCTQDPDSRNVWLGYGGMKACGRVMAEADAPELIRTVLHLLAEGRPADVGAELPTLPPAYGMVNIQRAPVLVDEEAELAELIVRPPHEQRVIEEYIELAEKLKKLHAFVDNNPTYLSLEKEEQLRLRYQREHMWKYLRVLGDRMLAWAKPAEGYIKSGGYGGIPTGLSFGQALSAMEQGFRVARIGWHREGKFAYMVPAASYPVQTGAAKEHYGEGAMVPYNAYMALKEPDNRVSTWVPSSSDCLAKDWEVL